MLCGDLNRKEIQKSGEIYMCVYVCVCVCIADLFYCAVETNTTL